MISAGPRFGVRSSHGQKNQIIGLAEFVSPTSYWLGLQNRSASLPTKKLATS
jgi:hypothetical protein